MGGNLLKNIWEYPHSVYFILLNEFCERFSFYGMKALLPTYLIQEHHVQQDTMRSIYHGFISLCYVTPLIGSVLADSYFGRARVILIVSLFYVFGHALLSVGAFPSVASGPRQLLDYIGLFVIAFGMGGIKPCVSAFAADQFDPVQIGLRSQFFSFFYFSINAGGFCGMALTPYLRSGITCLGADSCFALAFAVPGILMLIAFLIFLLGWRKYKKLPPAKENVGWMVISCIAISINRTIRRYPIPREDRITSGTHSKRSSYRNSAEYSFPLGNLNPALSLEGSETESVIEGTYNRERVQTGESGEIEEEEEEWVKGFTNRVRWLERSRETFTREQVAAVKSVCGVVVCIFPMVAFWALSDQQGSTWVLQGFQMDCRIFNGFLILPEQLNVLNPLFILILIPILEGFVYPLVSKFVQVTPLRKMSLGGFLTALAFFISALVQISIDSSLPPFPSPGHAHLRILGGHKMNTTRNGTEINTKSPNGVFEIPIGEYGIQSNGMEYRMNCGKEGVLYMVSERNNALLSLELLLEKSTNGRTNLYLFMENDEMKGGKAFLVVSGVVESSSPLIHGSLISIQPKSSKTFQLFYGTNCEDINCPQSITFKSGMGALQVIRITNERQPELITVIPPNSISLLWQIPQLFLITLGEALLSITGLDFAYSQSAPNVRSVLQALWSLTVCGGNLFASVIATARLFRSAAIEMVAYGVMMIIVMILFSTIAWFYEYVPGTVECTVIHEKREQNEQKEEQRRNRQ